MRLIRWFFIIVVVLWGVFVLAQVGKGDSEVYQGTVVDEETGQPLEGAVVVVLRFKKPWLAMDGPNYFHKGTEVLTDAEGKFWIDAAPGINLNPFTFLRSEPWIVIFKPGYGPLTGAYPRGLTNMLEELRKGVTVRLPKLKTREELRDFADSGSVGIGSNTPSNRIPNLIRLINIQRKSLGFDPIW